MVEREDPPIAGDVPHSYRTIQTIYQDLLVWDNAGCSGTYGALSVIPSQDTSIAISIPGSTNSTKSNTMPITHFPSTITIIRLYLSNPFASKHNASTRAQS
ncbi:hypothetical protein SeLEV6574_g02185 [Synchytrium endobioticum]|uniref:Uncharacterized protein n=1 Tax=Synchytrium endobioticum TaxID=286115 RepID=A0A507D9L3_9FUNG|nr:hypothetical protein SeLEV6574_g02158 [Synchytrium endobioticum]TPX48214.1 hypothetical protein SeLEV6574_g02185 [Synchytrium endobioticum]